MDPQITSNAKRLRELELRVEELERRFRKVWHSAPLKPEEGMIAFADGTDWDPLTDGTVGYVQYVAGAWISL